MIDKYTRYRRTLRGKIYNIYDSQIVNSKTRGHEPPSYSKQEFYDWCINSVKFLKLFKRWESSNYKKELSPSIDRKNDYLPYSFKNIHVCTWKENFDKGHSDRKVGINNKQNKAVLQFDLDGNFIKEFHSLSEASRKLNISAGDICRCCNLKRKTAGSYKWKYKTL